VFVLDDSMIARSGQVHAMGSAIHLRDAVPEDSPIDTGATMIQSGADSHPVDGRRTFTRSCRHALIRFSRMESQSESKQVGGREGRERHLSVWLLSVS
jgi:hypothetical protein